MPVFYRAHRFEEIFGIRRGHEASANKERDLKSSDETEHDSSSDASDSKPELDSSTASTDSPSKSTNSPSKKKQFGIAALFWATFAIGLTIAYLQQLDQADILVGGLIAVAIGIVVGLIVGRLVGNVFDALFWSTLIAAFGYISVASDPMYSHLGHRLAWAGVGAMTGAIGATCWTNRIALNLFVCGLVAFLVMLGFSLVTTFRSADLTIDVNMSPFIGFAIGVFLFMLRWVESNHDMPRYVTATWLLAAVILGNLYR